MRENRTSGSVRGALGNWRSYRERVKTGIINMPEIARFYGIIIKLFFGDHPPPHFHAVYGEHVGLFNIETLEMIEGDLPKRAKKLIIEWATLNKSQLKEMWKTQEFHKLPPLD